MKFKFLILPFDHILLGASVCQATAQWMRLLEGAREIAADILSITCQDMFKSRRIMCFSEVEL
jgi:hypothetical protein